MKQNHKTIEPKDACDNAAVREALEALLSEIGDYVDGGLEIVWGGIKGKTIRKARAALSAPRRNCEVGTAEEQTQRFENFCKSHPFAAHGGARCENCPLEVESCQLEWAQMPCEEGGNDGNE